MVTRHKRLSTWSRCSQALVGIKLNELVKAKCRPLENEDHRYRVSSHSLKGFFPMDPQLVRVPRKLPLWWWPEGRESCQFGRRRGMKLCPYLLYGAKALICGERQRNKTTRIKSTVALRVLKKT